MPIFKYIITDYGAILFNENTTHSQVGTGFEKIYAAGFVHVKMIRRDVEIDAYGRSESLNIESVPMIDKIIIEDLFVAVSKIKYLNMCVKSFYEDPEPNEKL